MKIVHETDVLSVTVYGVDEASASEDFVTALLSNPFDATGEQSQVLCNRWKDTTGDSLTVSYVLSCGKFPKTSN